MKDSVVVEVYQPAKKELTANHYDSSLNVAFVSKEGDVFAGASVSVGKSMSNKKQEYWHFTVALKNEKGEILKTTNTTNYHKAIGLAVSYTL
jgi:hypothetical protein